MRRQPPCARRRSVPAGRSQTVHRPGSCAPGTAGSCRDLKALAQRAFRRHVSDEGAVQEAAPLPRPPRTHPYEPRAGHQPSTQQGNSLTSGLPARAARRRRRGSAAGPRANATSHVAAQRKLPFSGGHSGFRPVAGYSSPGGRRRWLTRGP